ncbi:hypothetical protein AB1Y20_015413 [Prymnesium parvum]|uniref:RING-type E3 ubiquitin transferase n=1 Tax=Prymnesium parvum TaxID=97485 RepID=A0AB34JYB0_PRYPA
MWAECVAAHRKAEASGDLQQELRTLTALWQAAPTDLAKRNYAHFLHELRLHLGLATESNEQPLPQMGAQQPPAPMESDEPPPQVTSDQILSLGAGQPPPPATADPREESLRPIGRVGEDPPPHRGGWGVADPRSVADPPPPTRGLGALLPPTPVGTKRPRGGAPSAAAVPCASSRQSHTHEAPAEAAADSLERSVQPRAGVPAPSLPLPTSALVGNASASTARQESDTRRSPEPTDVESRGEASQATPAGSGTAGSMFERRVDKSAVEKSLECPVCIDLMYQPVTTICGHSFCRECYVRHVDAAISRGAAASCPNCRRTFSAEHLVLHVNVSLWQMIQTSFPRRVATRKADLAARASELVSRDGTVDQLEAQQRLRVARMAIGGEMERHRGLLTAVMPDYFAKLREELARPSGELTRCACPPRYVCIRRAVTALSSNHGRYYYACPLRATPTSDKSKGCNFFAWVV